MTATRGYKTDERAARAWAKANGIVGAQGGWLYRNSRPLVQGYGQLAGLLRQRGLIVRGPDQKWRIAIEPVRVELHGEPDSQGRQSFTLTWTDPDDRTPKGQVFRTAEPVEQVRTRLEDTLARRAAEARA